MGALILLLLACAWPSSAPAPSQPLIVEVSLGGTADTRMAAEARHPRPEAVPALGSARSKPGPGDPAAEAEAGLGGVP